MFYYLGFLWVFSTFSPSCLLDNRASLYFIPFFKGNGWWITCYTFYPFSLHCVVYIYILTIALSSYSPLNPNHSRNGFLVLPTMVLDSGSVLLLYTMRIWFQQDCYCPGSGGGRFFYCRDRPRFYMCHSRLVASREM